MSFHPLAACALLIVTLLQLSLSDAQPKAAAPAVEQPRSLTTALAATALVARAEDVLASDAQHQLQRVLLNPERRTSASFSPAAHPRRIVPLTDGGVLLSEPHSETVHRVYLDGRSEALVSGQRVLTIAADATHFYWINLGAPYLRRAPLPPARQDRAPPPLPVEAVALPPPDELPDLVVDAGELFVADATKKSLLRVRGRGELETFAALPSAPSVLALSGDAIFIGARDGAIYRVERASRRVTRLGMTGGSVEAIAQDGCLVIAGSQAELVAFETVRGVRVPLVSGASVAGVALRGGRIFYLDASTNRLFELPAPACPPATVPDEAREVTARPAEEPAKPQDEALDSDPLALRAPSSVHTIVVRLETAEDEAARAAVRKRVERVLADPPREVWARATDAQVAALRKVGFLAAYRDGVDRVRCVDVRRDPRAALSPPPAPFFDSAKPRVFIMQLALPTHAIANLQDILSSRDATLLDRPEPATIYVSASATTAAGLAKLPFVTWIGPYGARERLTGLALTQMANPPEGGCGKQFDAPLRALAAWVSRAPKARVRLLSLLWSESADFKALVRRLGGRIHQDDSDDRLEISITRDALAELAAHPAVQVIEPFAEAKLDGD